MISKRIPSRRDGKSSASASLRYGAGNTIDRETGEVIDKAERIRLANFGLVDDGVYVSSDPSIAEVLELAAVEMQANCDENQRVSEDKKIAHFIFSYGAEKPSDAALRDTEDSAMAALGLSENHFATFLHSDNGFWHLHIFASRVSKESGHIHNSLWQDKTKRDRVCREVENRHGLKRDNGIHELDDGGNIVEVNKNERRKRREAKLEKPSDRAQVVEKYAGVETFQTWCRNIKIGDRLRSARSWSELHIVAGEYGCEVRKRGSGFIIKPIDTDGAITLSKIGLRNIEKRLGEYSEPSGREKEFINQKQSYKPKPLYPSAESKELYEKFSREKSEYQELRKAALDTLKDRHKVEREVLRERQKDLLKELRESKRGADRFAAVSLAKMGRAIASSSLSERHRLEREQLLASLAAKTPGQTFNEYLLRQAEGGNQEALTVLPWQAARSELQDSRQRELYELVASVRAGHRDKADLSIRPVKQLPAVSHKVTWAGDVVYRLGGGRNIIDNRKNRLIQFNPAGAQSLDTIEVALRFAQQKYGSRLTLTGPDEFIKNSIKVAVERGIRVEFADPKHEAYRAKLDATHRASSQKLMQEKRTNERAFTNYSISDEINRYAFDHLAEATSSAREALRLRTLRRGVVERGSRD